MKPVAEQLIFLHIPKTAGSTMHAILQRQYRAKEQCSIYKVNSHHLFYELPEPERARIRLLKGHLPFGIHKGLPRSSEYFTLLREPVDRVISHYHYIATDPAHPFYREFHDQKYSAAGLVSGGKILNMENCMVRFFSGEFDRPFGKTDEGMLEKALQHLDEYFPVIGLQEWFDIFLMRLAQRYGWQPPYYHRKRVGKNRVSVSDTDAETRETIEHYNRLDITLYKVIRARVEKEHAELPAEFYADLERFKKRNELLRRASGLFFMK